MAGAASGSRRLILPVPRVIGVAQAFKGSLGVRQVAAALEVGVRGAGAEPAIIPGSDGGDGLLEALDALLVRRTVHEASDPLGRSLRVPVGWLTATRAVVESRLVCGLSLLSDRERAPLRTSTRGLGTVIAQVVQTGAREVVVGLGGSATVDGGLGMARAWGWVPRDAQGEPLPEGGGALRELARLDPGRPPAARLVALCDVRTPLLGREGAAPVFAPQKGAAPADVDVLAAGLARLAAAARGGVEVAARPGAGAAGGLGWGMVMFGGATLTEGAAWILERHAFGRALETADAVVVAEASFDATSQSGKLSGEVIRLARAAGLPVALVAPRVAHAPAGIVVASGDGWWSVTDLARRTTDGVHELLRLLAR